MFSTAAVADYLTSYQAAAVGAPLPPSAFSHMSSSLQYKMGHQGSSLHLELSWLGDKGMLLRHMIMLCNVQTHAAIALYDSQTVNLIAQSLYILHFVPPMQFQSHLPVFSTLPYLPMLQSH